MGPPVYLVHGSLAFIDAVTQPVVGLFVASAFSIALYPHHHHPAYKCYVTIDQKENPCTAALYFKSSSQEHLCSTGFMSVYDL